MTDTVAPARSLDQRMEALERANVVRCYRAELKKDLAAGRGPRTVLDILAAPSELEETWKVFDVLMAVPRVGRVKANNILRRQGVSPSKTVAGLSGRQRRALLEALGGLPSVGRGIVRS